MNDSKLWVKIGVIGELVKRVEMGDPKAGKLMNKVETGGMKVEELVKKIQMNEPKVGKSLGDR